MSYSSRWVALNEGIDRVLTESLGEEPLTSETLGFISESLTDILFAEVRLGRRGASLSGLRKVEQQDFTNLVSIAFRKQALSIPGTELMVVIWKNFDSLRRWIAEMDKDAD